MEHPAARVVKQDAIAAAGGFSVHIHNRRIAEEWVDRAWLIHEGGNGYALTVEGTCLCRVH